MDCQPALATRADAGPRQGSDGIRQAAPTPTAARLFLDTDPSRAQVYAGPRRLGETPLSIDMSAESMEITLSYPGRPDLSYTIRRADGPKLMLRLPPGAEAGSPEPRGPHHEHHHRDRGKEDKQAPVETPSPGPTSPPTSPGQPDTTPVRPATPNGEKKPLKVKVLDDDDPPQKQQKTIKPID